MIESSPQNCSTVAVAVNTLLVSLTLRFIAARQTLCDWVDFRATMAKPLDIQGVQVLASVISGKQPGKNWIGRYKKRNPDLCQSRPGGLDPKRAQNFNPSNVARFYDLLKAIYDVYPDLPPQHI